MLRVTRGMARSPGGPAHYRKASPSSARAFFNKISKATVLIFSAEVNYIAAIEGTVQLPAFSLILLPFRPAFHADYIKVSDCISLKVEKCTFHDSIFS